MSRHHHLALLLAVCAVASAAEENATGFLAARLGGDRAEAEDLLQQSFAKALSAAPHLRDEERLVPWFYQLLRNALIDRVRSRQAASARARRWA
jgi:RNA polymerase sigma-70 factor (ECF subfamily)